MSNELEAAGFELDTFDQYHLEGNCKITVYQSCGKWEVDIVLPNGDAIGMDADRIAHKKPSDSKPNIYIGANAPEFLRDILTDIAVETNASLTDKGEKH